MKPDCESVEPPPVCSLRHTTHAVWQEMLAREAAREAQGTPLPAPVARVPPPGSYPLAEREPFHKAFPGLYVWQSTCQSLRGGATGPRATADLVSPLQSPSLVPGAYDTPSFSCLCCRAASRARRCRAAPSSRSRSSIAKARHGEDFWVSFPLFFGTA